MEQIPDSKYMRYYKYCVSEELNMMFQNNAFFLPLNKQ